MGTKSYRPWTPRQGYLLPPSPTEWLPGNHLAYFILDVVERLDMSAIERVIAARDPRGERPYSPRMLLAMLVYGYCTGTFSSRKLARETYEDVAFRVLCGGAHPHFTTINQFRLDHREAFKELFVQVLQLCKKAGLVKLGHVSIDGTKVSADASKHKAMSYERMQEEEARLRGEISEMLANAEATDQAEDERYGIGVSAEDLPEELSRRETRLERIEQAMAALQREAAEARAAELRERAEVQREKSQDSTVDQTERQRAATRASKNDAQADKLDPPDDTEPPSAPDTDLPQHRVPRDVDGTPKPEAQRNFTDPDSRIMVKDGAYVQAYNAQIAVDAKAQIIVAQAVTNQPPDVEHLLPMLDRVQQALGRLPEKVSADSGYCSDDNIAACEARQVDAYIAVARTRHGDSPDGQPARMSSARAAMKQKVESPQGHEVYSRRKVIAEPPIGQIKSAQGFRRFLLRGLEKVRCEWALVCTTHNLLKLFRAAHVQA